MIAAVKTKGVPLVWVGLPAIRGAKGTSDMLFLDSLYREAAAKAGITYVDVWDGFVDEGGLFLQKGPDFEGQVRQLRSYDGVYFTKPGARKLAHCVDREITRLLAARSAPIALPTEPATPDANAVPGQPAPRPLAGTDRYFDQQDYVGQWFAECCDVNPNGKVPRIGVWASWTRWAENRKLKIGSEQDFNEKMEGKGFRLLDHVRLSNGKRPRGWEGFVLLDQREMDLGPEPPPHEKYPLQ
jgi:hypothetical protein